MCPSSPPEGCQAQPRGCVANDRVWDVGHPRALQADLGSPGAPASLRDSAALPDQGCWACKCKCASLPLGPPSQTGQFRTSMPAPVPRLCVAAVFCNTWAPADRKPWSGGKEGGPWRLGREGGVELYFCHRKRHISCLQPMWGYPNLYPRQAGSMACCQHVAACCRAFEQPPASPPPKHLSINSSK